MHWFFLNNFSRILVKNVPCLIFPFIFSDSLRYVPCARMRTVFFISIRLVNFYLVLLGTISWFLNFRILKFSIFWNFFEFGFSLVAVLFFRISNIFSTSFYGVYEGLILLFYLFFIKIYIKTRFSLNKILLQLTGRLFGCCDWFEHWGRTCAQAQNQN